MSGYKELDGTGIDIRVVWSRSGYEELDVTRVDMRSCMEQE